MYYIICDFISLIAVSVNYLIILNRLKINTIKDRAVIFIIVNSTISLILLENRINLLLFPTSILIMYIYIYLKNRKKIYSLLAVIITLIIFAVSDAVTGFFAIYLFDIDFNTLSNYSITYSIIILVVILISYILSTGIRKAFDKIAVNDRNIGDVLKNKLAILIYFCFIVALIYINIITYKYYVKNIDSFVISLNAISVISNFIIVILLFYYNSKRIKMKLEEEFREKEVKQIIEYTEMIESMSDDLRRFKHDYLNIMQALSEYINDSDMKGLQEFYRNELQPENEIIIKKNTSLYLLKNIGVISIKGLLSSKVHYASLKGIETYLEITDKIEKIDIRELDICRILGILIDNAIEAAESCSQKVIRIAIIAKQDYTTFIIKNTCPIDTPPIYKIYEDGFSTKGEKRGLGLKTVRKIINEKYNNVYLNTKIKDSIFQQELVIESKERVNL